MYNQGPLDASGTRITGNRAVGGGGGIYDDGPEATATLTGSSPAVQQAGQLRAARLDHRLHRLNPAGCTPVPGQAGPGCLGIATGGKPVFIGLAPGSGGSADAWSWWPGR